MFVAGVSLASKGKAQDIQVLLAKVLGEVLPDVSRTERVKVGRDFDQ